MIPDTVVEGLWGQFPFTVWQGIARFDVYVYLYLLVEVLKFTFGRFQLLYFVFCFWVRRPFVVAPFHSCG